MGPAVRRVHMRFVILHYHIFKNAGSTIEDILDHSFGDRFGQLETGVNGGLIANTELVRYLDARPGLCAFSSHQIRYPLPEAPGYLFFDICFLRDPIDRLRSFYDYFRQRPNPGDPISALANTSGSLGDFVAGMIRDHSLFVRNNQVNLLACGGDSDEPDERDLSLAIHRMRAASFLGVVDRFGESVSVGAAALRTAFPGLDWARPAVNVSRGMEGTVAERVAELRNACDPEVYNELQRITALDRRLVESARDEVRRRARAMVPATVRARPLRPVTHFENAGLLTTGRRIIGLAPYWRELAGEPGKVLFDADYYRASATGKPHSFRDFLVEGAYQGRQPHPLFDPAFYLRKYPDVAAAGVNPFCHYLKHGYKEMRQPHPLFDPAFYLSRNPDVRLAGLNPLLHYVRHGAQEDRKPHPLFDPKYYRASCGKKMLPGQNPLAHFLGSGAAAANPHPLFDCDAYLTAHPEAAEQDVNPLVHYLEFPRDTGALIAGKGSVFRLDVQDVALLAAWLDTETDAGAPGHWVAEPQQLPFLRALSVDQVLAQTLSAG